MEAVGYTLGRTPDVAVTAGVPTSLAQHVMFTRIMKYSVLCISLQDLSARSSSRTTADPMYMIHSSDASGCSDDDFDHPCIHVQYSVCAGGVA